jgi:hypothetical protein
LWREAGDSGANRCRNELHRVSTERHSRHDRRYTASVRSAICVAQETHSRYDCGNQSSDAGLLLLKHVERKLGVCRRLADAMPDRRDASRIS